MKFYRALAPRERRIVALGVVFLLAIALHEMVLGPLEAARHRTERQLSETRATLQELRLLQQEAARMSGWQDELERQLGARPKGFSLFAFLDELAGAAGVKNLIAYMKPSQQALEGHSWRLSRVEVKLQGVSLGQLTDYLLRIESTPQALSVRRLAMEKSGDGTTLDAVLQVETVER